jgi:uncharacterized protein
MKPESDPHNPLRINLRHLDEADLELDTSVAGDALDLEVRDELIQVTGPVVIRAHVQKLEEGLLIQGRVTLALRCECVRCLTPFVHEVVLDPWTLHLALEGEEAVPVVGDFVDLTPHLREDIFLAFPQHPLCTPDCQGLSKDDSRPEASEGSMRGKASPWAELDKLNLEP